MEQNRTSKILSSYQEAEIGLLDVKLQENVFSSLGFDCSTAISQTILFADKVYQESQVLDDYKNSARLSEGILVQYKKYSLLRTMLWLNTIKIKERCKNSIHTIVYFYDYLSYEEELSNRELYAKQEAISIYLGELKNEQENNIVLIPLAGDLDIGAIEILKTTYGIKTLPSVLVDEKLVVSELDDLDLIRDTLN